MKKRPLAAIDIGTNTFRLLIAYIQPKVSRKNDYTIEEIYSERIITRLGKGISEKRLIKKDAIERSITVLKKFSDIISHYKVQRVSAVATSALREAKNKDEFSRRIKNATGLEIEIISGEEEAKKTFSGMLIGINPPESALMVDIGGGSTEIIFTRQKKLVMVDSLNLGVVYLADKYMKNDPPLNKDLNQMGKTVSKNIMPVAGSFEKLFSDRTVFIGTAGTVTALAAVNQGLTTYKHSKIHSSKIMIEKVKRIFSDISTITARERSKRFPFEPERLDIIVPGTLILLKLMEIFGFKKVMVSNYGLREGILLDLYRRKR